MRQIRKKTYSTAYDLTGSPVLNYKITFKQQAEYTTELRQKSTRYEMYKECYAAVLDQTGKLANHSASDSVLVNTTHKFIVRYDSKITNGMMIEFQDKSFAIDYIQDKFNERRYLTIFASMKE